MWGTLVDGENLIGNHIHNKYVYRRVIPHNNVCTGETKGRQWKGKKKNKRGKRSYRRTIDLNLPSELRSTSVASYVIRNILIIIRELKNRLHHFTLIGKTENIKYYFTKMNHFSSCIRQWFITNGALFTRPSEVNNHSCETPRARSPQKKSILPHRRNTRVHENTLMLLLLLLLLYVRICITYVRINPLVYRHELSFVLKIHTYYTYTYGVRILSTLSNMFVE